MTSGKQRFAGLAAALRGMMRHSDASCIDCSQRVTACCFRLFLARHPAHQIELGIGLHAREAGHPVGQSEEGGNGRNVPDILVVKTVRVQGFVVGIVDFGAVQTDLHGKVQHGRSRGLMSALR
jgi:hypothetical protein